MRRSLPVAVALAAAALAVSSARAEEASRPGPAPRSHRELAGHQFMVSHLLEDPFSVTSFGMNFAIGAGQARGPVLDLSTVPPTIVPGETKWYAYTGLAQQFELGVRLWEYLSVRTSMTATAYQGTGGGSALVVGTSVRLSGLLGVKGSLPLGESLRFSLSADAVYGPALNILLLQGIIDAVNAGNFDQAAFLQESNFVTLQTTASGAWAPLPFLGLVANARYLHPQKEGRGAYSQNGVAFAASLEFDALPLVDWLPLGASVAYRLTSPVGTGGVTTIQEYGLGFNYTGRPDLALGLEINRREGRLETELVSDQTAAWLNFRYFW